MKKKLAKIAVGILVSAAMVVTSIPVDVFAGVCVGQIDFDEGIGLPWHTCQTNPASQTFEIANGTYNVTIKNPGGASRGGEDRWDLQLRHRGLKIESGHTYNVTFDINSTSDGQMCAKIGDLSGQIELWHNAQGLTETNTQNPKKPDDPNQSWDLLQIQKGDNHFECTFTAKQTLDIAEWAFHYGGSGKYTPTDCFPVGTTLKFDNLSLECTTCGEENGDGCNWDNTNEMGFVTPRSDVRLNQVGYFSNLSKVASYATDKEIAPVSFEVKNSSGKTVYEGTGVSKGKDEDSGEYVQLLDFTELKESGKDFTIEVSDKENVQTNRYTKEKYDMWKSQPFDIADPSKGENIYEGALTNALNYYYQNRSGVAIDSKYITSGDKATLAHQAGHVNDQAYVQSEWVKSYKSDGSDVDKAYQIDCTGGWYDAGDHGKYVVNGGISVWTLQNMYEMSKASGTESKWDDGKTMQIPENGNGTPDILDEARVELEWMFKMIVDSKDPYYGSNMSGMVYHKMHDHKWTGLGVKAWDYADKWGTIRIVKPPTTAATLNVAATAAQAARLWKGIDDTFAAKCLEKAKLTYEAAKANPAVYAPLDQAIGGGAYGDDYVEDDFYWAACELYATTGDQTYLDDLSSYKNKNDSTGNDKAFSLTTNLGGGENSGSFSSFNWGCTAGLGTLTLYLNEDKLADDQKESVESAIVSAADAYIAQEQNEGMGIPYRSTTFSDAINIGEGIEVNGYEWGSNSFVVNNAMVMAYAYKIKGTNEYMSGVSTAMDYIFGRNGLGISYVTGMGEYHTKSPHHRYWAHEIDSSFPSAPDGVMSGGAGSGLQDPYVAGLGYVRGKVAPQKCYVDSAEAWSVNEVTINWNAPFAWALSFIEDEAVTAPNADGSGGGSKPSVKPSTSKPSNGSSTSKPSSGSQNGSEGEGSQSGSDNKPGSGSQSGSDNKPGSGSQSGSDNKPSQGSSENDKPSNEPSQGGSDNKPSNKPSQGSSENDKPSNQPSQGGSENDKPSNEPSQGDSNNKPSQGGADNNKPGSGSQSGSDNNKPGSGSQSGSNDQPSNKPSQGGSDNNKPGSGSQSGSTEKPEGGSQGGSESGSSAKPESGEIVLGAESLLVKEGEEGTLKVFANGKDVTKDAQFVIADETKATVTTNNAIKGLKVGTTKVIVIYGDDSDVFDLYVTDKDGNIGSGSSSTTPSISTATGIDVYPKKVTLEKNKDNELRVLAKLDKDVLKDVTSLGATFKSADSSIVTVYDNNKIIGLKKGETTVTATWSNGTKEFSAECNVNVVEEGTAGSSGSTGDKVNVTEVRLNSTASVKAGEAIELQATVLPSNATNSTVIWTASSSAVQLIPNGDKVVVRANKEAGGQTVRITATAGAKQATCDVTILKTSEGGGSSSTDSSIYVKSISVDKKYVKMALNQKTSKAITVKVQPTNVKEQGLKVSTTSKNIATASYSTSKKKLTIKTGKKIGVAKLTLTTKAKTSAGKYVKKTLYVTVNPPKVSSVKKKAVSKNAVKLTWKKQTGISGYQVYYSGAGKKGTKNISKNATSYTLKGLKAGKKYSIKVRAYYKKSGYATGYGPYSTILKVTTKK
ncbi:MAG: glycoside hydrolase family 9 protein [Lachnospiraceae bacterium]